MTHKFKIGQRVQRVPGGPGTQELGEIIRLMPEDRAGEPAYRIRTDTGERAARESELAPLKRP